MAALIPAQVVDELLQQQHQANQPTQADPRVLAGIFHPAMQLQMAQALRQRQAGGNAPMANAPIADHIRQAKAAGTQGTPMAEQQAAQQQNPQAGTMSIQPGNAIPNRDVTHNGPMPMSRDAIMSLAQTMGQHPDATVTGNGGATTATGGREPMNPQAMHQWAARSAAMGDQGHMLPNGGFQVSGLNGPQQQAADPVGQALSAFQGKVPDDMLQRAGAAIHAGAHAPAVLSELEKMVQQGNTRSEAAKEKETARTEGNSRMLSGMRVRHLEAQEKTAADHGEDTAGYEKQIQEEMNKAAGPQQQAVQAPQPPKPGHPLDSQNAQHFMQMAGGDKGKARELAKQAGWSF